MYPFECAIVWMFPKNSTIKLTIFEFGHQLNVGRIDRIEKSLAFEKFSAQSNTFRYNLSFCILVLRMYMIRRMVQENFIFLEIGSVSPAHSNVDKLLKHWLSFQHYINWTHSPKNRRLNLKFCHWSKFRKPLYSSKRSWNFKKKKQLERFSIEMKCQSTADNGTW